jgi:kumamolisin
MFIPKDRIPLAGSERTIATNAQLVGAAAPDEILEVTLRLRAKTQLKSAPRAHSRLSREEFEKTYSASEADIRAVEDFAHEHELTVLVSDAARRTIVLRGTVAQFSAAFGVELRQYDYPQGRFRTRTGPVYIPRNLDNIVTGVFGLDNRPQAKPHFRVNPSRGIASPKAQPAGFTPTQVAKAYQFPANTNGTGQCIALIELGGGYRSTDLARYFKSLGISTPPRVTAISVNGGLNQPTGDPNGADGEVMLDVEVAGAVAPGASIAVYFAPNTDAGFLNAITTAVHDKKNNPSIVSISWGGPESSWTQQALDAMNEALAAAATIGVTVCIAAGDDGATDGLSDGQLHVDFPASSPWALACGGTRLTLASGIPTDVVWNDLSSGEGATGGGYSAYFPRPDYQSKAVTQSARGVPDLAADADPETGYQVMVDGQSTVIGGTSAVAPLMAGLIASINQSTGAPVGFINPTVYQHQEAFRDVTSGNNDGEVAGPGWDACTGMGVPIGSKLEQVLAAAQRAASAAAA